MASPTFKALGYRGWARMRTHPFCVRGQDAHPDSMRSAEPVRRRRVMDVVLVEQCDQGVDVEQRPHGSDSHLLAKLVDQLVGDDGSPSRNGVEAMRLQYALRPVGGHGKRAPMRPRRSVSVKPSGARPGSAGRARQYGGGAEESCGGTSADMIREVR